jgi:hypothetical protein
VQAIIEGKQRQIGYFKSELEAAQAYDTAILAANLPPEAMRRRQLNFPGGIAPPAVVGKWPP